MTPAKEVGRGNGWSGKVVDGLSRVGVVLHVATPGRLVHSPYFSMSNHHLFYAISKRTPPSPKVLKAIADVQAELNRRCTWTHERLSLAPVARQPVGAPFAFPFVSLSPSRPAPALRGREPEAPGASRIEDAFASGSTKVRDNLWNAHLVVAFLRRVSTAHPELLLELRDDGGFVLPGAVWIQNGTVELQRDWLNRERARALELTGDPQAAAPYVWAEAEALGGRFFLEAEASDFAEVREIRELDLDWEQLQSVNLQDLAEVVVERAAASKVPDAA